MPTNLPTALVLPEATPAPSGKPVEACEEHPAGPCYAAWVYCGTATSTCLDALPGVGPATAAAIVAYRDEHGPFGSVDDVGKVHGIGPAKLDAIRDLVTV